MQAPCYGPRQPRPTIVAAFEAYLRERIAAVPELTGSRLLREIRELGYAGGYTAVKDFLRTVRPAALQVFERRFETPPGTQAQVDFAYFRTRFTDEPGAERVVWLFSLVLGHSRMMWARFVARQDLQTVLRCHIAAFEALGGVPAEILYDRMKTAVLGEVDDQGIAYNAKLLDLAGHYGFLPKACKPYRAKTKGKVERPFRYVREDFFLGRSFRNLDDLNAQLRHWLDTVANSRRHATTGRVVLEHFAEEAPHHLMFAQPRAMGSKVSDEWTVPLCYLHHRALHDHGAEERWWQERDIDPLAKAQRLWQETRRGAAPTDALEAPAPAQEAEPAGAAAGD